MLAITLAPATTISSNVLFKFSAARFFHKVSLKGTLTLTSYLSTSKFAIASQLLGLVFIRRDFQLTNTLDLSHTSAISNDSHTQDATIEQEWLSQYSCNQSLEVVMGSHGWQPNELIENCGAFFAFHMTPKCPPSVQIRSFAELFVGLLIDRMPTQFTF